MSLTNDEKECLAAFRDIELYKMPLNSPNRIVEALIHRGDIDGEIGERMEVTESGQKFYEWLIAQENSEVEE